MAASNQTWLMAVLPAEDPIIGQARQLAALVADHAEWSEDHRQQEPSVARKLSAAGFHRSGVPTSHGGLGRDPRTMIRLIEEISAADGAAGWTMMIGIEVLGVASGYLPKETIRSILTSKPDTIVAGAANPVGVAVPVDGGFRVSGRWPFGSGVHNADWWWGGCLVDDGSGRTPRRFVQALIPADQVSIIDTWSVSGLVGSGSHDVETEDCFVPHDHMSDLSTPPNSGDPVFAMPVTARFAFNKVGVATGIARSAIEAFTELAGHKTARGERSQLAERPRAQLAVAEATALVGSGRAWVFEVVDELWSACLAGQPITPQLHATVRLACSHAVQQAVRAVELVHAAAGSSANFRDSPLERQFRDIHVVPQQITVAPHMIETAGRVLLGLDPDSLVF